MRGESTRNIDEQVDMDKTGIDEKRGLSSKWVSFDFRPSLLGLGVAAATATICARSSSPLVQEMNSLGSIRDFLVAALVACTIAGVLILLSALKGKRVAKHLPTWYGAVPVTIGICLLALSISVTNISGPSAIVGGVLSGIGGIALLVSWGRLYSLLEAESALFHTALSIACSALLYLIASALPTSISVLGFIIILVLGSTYLLHSASNEVDESKNETEQPLGDDNAARKQTLRTIGVLLWKPLCGAALCAFISGLVWDVVLSQSGGPYLPSWPNFGLLLGPLIAATLILVPILLRNRKFTPSLLYQVILPVAAAIVLVMPSLESDTAAIWNTISGVAGETGFAFFDIAVWVALTTTTRATKLSPTFVFGLGQAVLAVATLLGMILIFAIGVGGKIVSLLLITIYLVFLAATMTRNDQQNVRRKIDLEEYLGERCAELGTHFLLSPREKEVLLYLSRGHSHVYIAETLFISENTVRSHVRKIYDKMGISSREELLKLIDSETDAATTKGTAA